MRPRGTPAPKCAILTTLVAILAADGLAQAPARDPGAFGRSELLASAQEALLEGRLLPVIVSVRTEVLPEVDLAGLRELRLRRAGPAELRRLLGTFEVQAAVHAALVRPHLEALGGRLKEYYWILPAFSAEVPPGALGALLDLPFVESVAPDPDLPHALYQATDAAHHDVDAAYALGVTGDGTVVAILDSGADADMNGTGRPHALFYVDGDPLNMTGGGIGGSRLLSADVYSNATTPEDQHGHGTFVASCAIGEDYYQSNGRDDRGAAPGARVRVLKIDNANGKTPGSNMISAFQALPGYGDVRVANMSYVGDSDPAGPLTRTIDRVVWLGDIAVTLAAGNSGSDLRFAHATHNGIPVGAVAKTKVLTSFSAIGPLHGRLYPLLVATGLSLSVGKRDRENSSATVSGTSFSAPITAGALALIRQAAPGATAQEAKALLLQGLDDTATGNANGLGLGYLKARGPVVEALAGNYRTIRLDADGARESYRLPLTAGQELRLAAVWDLQDTSNTDYHDVRVSVFNPDGTPFQAEGNGVDLHAHFRSTAVQTGLHRVTLELMGRETGTEDAFVAVAGLLAANPANEVSLVVPDEARARTTIPVEISGGEPNGTYTVFAGFNPAPVLVSGTWLDVGPAKSVRTGTLDALGTDSFPALVPRSLVNRTVYLEVLVQGAAGSMDSNLEVLRVTS